MKIHPDALVESTQIGEGTCVWAFAHVLAGAQIGFNTSVGGHAFIEGGSVVGNNVTIKNQVCIWEGVTIEDDVFVGPRVTFTNDRYPRSPRMESAKHKYATRSSWLVRTTVRRGCSIGAAATICPDVELGPYSVVAAGAVVTSDVPAYALVSGVPAKHRRDVCTCGNPLEGRYDVDNCNACGETGEARAKHLHDATQP